MSQLTDLFQPICGEVQTKLQSALRGFAGPIVRGYLPQEWMFRTEEETATFSVDKAGNASVAEGDAKAPDVIIIVDHKYLCEALRTRKRPAFKYKLLDVRFRTSKGETAFNYVRGQLGL